MLFRVVLLLVGALALEGVLGFVGVLVGILFVTQSMTAAFILITSLVLLSVEMM